MKRMTVILAIAWLAAAAPAMAATEDNQSNPPNNSSQGSHECERKKEAPTS
jgi:hypothetical protein